MRGRDARKCRQHEAQFYLSILPVKVKRLAKAIRGHWSIENQLHWMLDLVFAQDSSRIRKGNGPVITSMLRQLALMILTQDTQFKGSITGNGSKPAGITTTSRLCSCKFPIDKMRSPLRTPHAVSIIIL